MQDVRAVSKGRIPEILEASYSENAASDFKDVIEYYNECWLERLKQGHNSESLAIHFGIYDTADMGTQSAKLNLNARLEAALGRRSDLSHFIMDLGCGIGGTALYLASQNPDWSIWGIDVNPREVSFATHLAKDRALTSRLNFLCGDYQIAAMPPMFFDAVYSVESLCHCSCRRELFGRVKQSIKPGGCFVVIDFFRTGTPLASSRDVEIYETVKKGFRIHDYFDESPAELSTSLGFSHVEFEDLSSSVYPGVLKSSSTAACRLEEGGWSEKWVAHFKTLVSLEEMMERGLLSYGIFKATDC